MSLREPIASTETGLRGIIAIKAFYGILFFVIGLGVFALINRDISDLAEKAVADVLEQGYRTIDIMQPGNTLVGTARMGDLVAGRVVKG